MLKVSEDGYIRLFWGAACDIQLVHLFSGLDEEPFESFNFTTRICEVSGYTEWVSVIQPVISFGWDWRLVVDGSCYRYERLGSPRSNLMLIDKRSLDLSPIMSSTLIELIIDALDWQSETARMINERYALR